MPSTATFLASSDEVAAREQFEAISKEVATISSAAEEIVITLSRT